MSMAGGHLATIGLGGNLGDAPHTLSQALQQLAGPCGQLLAWSSLYRSRAIGPAGQPDYANAVALVWTHATPLALLTQLQQLENRHGRERSLRWGARTLDLDLLLFDAEPWHCDRLQLPHPELLNRDFVVQPLLEADPDAVLPDGRLLRTLPLPPRGNGLTPWPDPRWPAAVRLDRAALDRAGPGHG